MRFQTRMVMTYVQKEEKTKSKNKIKWAILFPGVVWETNHRTQT